MVYGYIIGASNIMEKEFQTYAESVQYEGTLRLMNHARNEKVMFVFSDCKLTSEQKAIMQVMMLVHNGEINDV